MKTCLAFTSLAVLSLHSLTSAQDLKIPLLLRKADVTISQSYTPFGNKPEFNKFGDDGSSCVLDANGVLTWIDNTGVVRVLPNSDLAVPLYVTSTECLVWNNRFVDHSSYKDRPKAEIKLYRAERGSTTLTEQLISTAGVEVLDTPPITTTTAPFTFITTTRKDNGNETSAPGGSFNNSDDCEIRVYRVTAQGSIQLLKTDNREVKNAPNFATNTEGPDVSALSYGSDGSVVLNIADAYVTRQVNPNYIQQVLWLDDQGNSKEVYSGAKINVNIFSTSKTRLLYKVAPGNDPSLNISLDNGESTTGITPAPTSTDTTTGVVNGALQVETATAAGTPAGTSPIVNVIVTADGLAGSPKTYEVAVSATDTPAVWAGKVRAKLNDDAALKALYDISGTSDKIVLTRKAGSSYDLRRSASVPTAISLPLTMNAPLVGYTINSEQPIDFFDFTNLSDKRYIHTLGTLDGFGPLDETSVISTYQITSNNPVLVSRAAPGIKISSAALVAAVDPVDGSALIIDEENAPIIWLHSGTGTDGGIPSTNYSVIPNSGQAKELYVTNTQAVIWENADAAKNANGSIPAPIVKHYSRNTTTGALTASPIYLDGSVLLNTPRSTPAADYWLITTAEKPNAATATLRTYALRDGSSIDTDGDGLVDSVETNTGTYATKTNTGTDPYDADTDDDGVNDGDEVYAFEITDPALGWAAAKADAEARGGWLATIADNDEHKALVRKIGSRSFSSYWLGAADTEATQVETATAAGNITGNGTANATITASGLTGGNKSFSIPVLANDTPTAWAAKVRAALVADSAVAGLFNVSGSGDKIVLARKTRVANDGTLNLALSNGTSTGISAAPSSVDTRASAARAARTFRWADFTSFDPALAASLFRPGEPNGIASLNALSLRNDFKWTDDPATEARSYVVEYPWSDPTSTDTDADGLADNEERTLNGNPNNPDSDSDGLNDGIEKTAGTSLILVDTDGDTLTDYAERITHNTDPLKKDTDGDALEDDDEISLGTDPRDTDTDNDNLTDGDEVTRGTNPKDKDSDTDGLDDDKEVLVHLTDPTKSDTDGDLISDSEEVSKGTDPRNDKDPKAIDTDKDNLTNFDEIYVHTTDPKKADTDGDGLNDDLEVLTHFTDPNVMDTDDDGFTDFAEVRATPPTDPNDASSTPPYTPLAAYNKSQFVNQVDVKIAQPYTPFGNRPEFNRFGDDGSKCVLDANGVLTWVGNKGEVRLLPDTSKAVPLFVTNTECLVWMNRFVDYDTYPNRPNAQLRLYRSTAGNNQVSFQDVDFLGKEIIDTPQVTTSTGALTFVSATRKDNENETENSVTGQEFNYSDDCELRFYRLTFDAGVQFVATRTVQIQNVEDFEINANGPKIDALGYGSDGSMAIKIIDERVQPGFKNLSANTGVPDYEARTYWIDNQGRFLRVVKDQSYLSNNTQDPDPCSRVLFMSNTRMIYEHASTGGVTGIQEQRRSSTTGNLLPSSTKDLTSSVRGTTLDIWNYSQLGTTRYFYTVNLADEVVGGSDDSGTIVRTYRVNSDGVSLVRQTTLANGLTISPATATGTVNSQDGSALLVSEDGDALIWLHASGTGNTDLANSSLASALFVTNDQAVIWENAKAPVGSDGKIPPAVVMHYNRAGLSGTPKNIISASQAGTTVSLQIKNHGFAVGDSVTISGLTGSTPANGTFVVASVPSPNNFTYKFNISQTATFGVDAAGIDYDGTLIVTDDDTALLNTSRLTPADPNFWLFTTATKTDPSTSRLVTYRLGTAEIKNPSVDSDGDGVNDVDEINIHNTDPTSADTDGDGLSDFTEALVLFSDPNDPNDFVNPNLIGSPNGRYEGLLYSQENGLVGRIILTLTTSGGEYPFTGTYEDIYGESSSISGKFDNTGALASFVSNLDFDPDLVTMVLRKSGAVHHLQVAIDTQTAGMLYAKARPSLATYPRAYRLTFEAKYLNGEAAPSGTAVATGSITTSAGASFQIYLPDGSTSTYSGKVLDGDVIALYSKSTSAAAPALLGNIKLEKMAPPTATVPATTNLRGYTRLVTEEYDQLRELMGAIYTAPNRSSLPLKNFTSRTSNAVLNWSDGILANAYQVVSWSPTRVTPPRTNYDSMTATFTSSTGLMKVDYTRSEKDRNLTNAKTTAFAVVNQAASTVNGFYFGSGSTGGFRITPNTGLLTVPVIIPPTPPTPPTPPPYVQGSVTSISPISKVVRGAGETYTVRVIGTNNWRITLPDWITITNITNDDGSVYTPTPNLVGKGNATVTVTVPTNLTNRDRIGNVTFHSKTHKVTQYYR